jgi:ribosomal protein S18 acetylase RimI-like enzyme
MQNTIGGQPMQFRMAVPDDAAAVATLVRSAYRGEESRAGWTTEADLFTDERIDADTVRTKITAPRSFVLLGHDDEGELLACCEILDRGEALAYFGMFAVRPTQQAAGVGRQVLAEAERLAVAEFGAHRLEMTVIALRHELIGWYERRGYVVTEERRPFPYGELVNGDALRDDLDFAVLVKDLG